MATSTIALTGTPHNVLQGLVDKAANFNVLVSPDESQPPLPLNEGGKRLVSTSVKPFVGSISA